MRALAASYGLLAIMQALGLLRFGAEIDWTAPPGWTDLSFPVSFGIVAADGLVSCRHRAAAA